MSQCLSSTILFTHGTVVGCAALIDENVLGRFADDEIALKEKTMKTDWNETFRFDEEEIELAQNMDTFDNVTSKSNLVIRVSVEKFRIRAIIFVHNPLSYQSRLFLNILFL